MPPAFKASIITPESILLETTITAAQVPAFDGLIGILDHRAPLLAKLGTGVLQLSTTSSGQQRFLVSGGYAQMKDDQLTILTTTAVPADQITPDSIAKEQSKLSAITGNDLAAMEKRQALQARISTMRSLVANN